MRRCRWCAPVCTSKGTLDTKRETLDGLKAWTSLGQQAREQNTVPSDGSAATQRHCLETMQSMCEWGAEASRSMPFPRPCVDTCGTTNDKTVQGGREGGAAESPGPQVPAETQTGALAANA